MTPRARILDVTVAEYHADPLPVPSLSASIAKVLVAQSAAHARLRHPKLGGVREEPDEAMMRGSLIHCLVLGKGGDIQAIDAKDWRTNAAKEARETAWAEHKIPVLAHKLTDAQTASEAIARQLADMGIVLNPEHSEIPLTWEEETVAGVKVVCRGMLDNLEGTVYDLKTITSARPDACEKAIVNNGYDIQVAAYTSAARKLTERDVVPFSFIFAECEPPYCVTVGEPMGMLRELGERRWQKAVEMWARCLKTNQWPGYSTKPVLLDAPAWMLAQEMPI